MPIPIACVLALILGFLLQFPVVGLLYKWSGSSFFTPWAYSHLTFMIGWPVLSGLVFGALRRLPRKSH